MSRKRPSAAVSWEAGPCSSTAAASGDTERIFLFPAMVSLLFGETSILRLVTYVSDVQLARLLNACDCADNESGSAGEV